MNSPGVHIGSPHLGFNSEIPEQEFLFLDKINTALIANYLKYIYALACNTSTTSNCAFVHVKVAYYVN